MPSSVVVWDPIPLVRRGLCTVLGRCADEVHPESLTAWARGDDAEVAVLSVVRADHWRHVSRVAGVEKAIVIVVLLEWSNPEAVRRALTLGATAAIPRASPVKDVVRTVASATTGLCVTPKSSLALDAGPTAWTDEERSILQALAAGQHVTEWALTLGYSRRTAARRLRGIYDRLGVSKACEATIAAARLGLIA